MAVDIRDLILLSKTFEQSPTRFEYAVCGMLNSMAYGTRQIAIDKIIPQTMIVRNRSFVRKFLVYKKANQGASVNSIYSIVFSIRNKNVTGWAEQDIGLEDPRKKKPVLYARKGSKTKRVLDKFKMKKGVKFPHPENYPGTSKHLKNVIMMQILSRESNDQPFVIQGHNRLTPGFYKFEGKRGNSKSRGNQKIRMIQKFNRAKDTIAKKPWMSPSIRKYFEKDDWFENFDRFLINSGYKKM